MKEVINNNRNLIYMLCDLMEIKRPDIYYFYKTKGNFKLYDKYLNLISYDQRDLNTNVKYIKYIYKENTIYVNLKIYEDVIRAYVVIIKIIRGIYQYEQAQRYSKDLPCCKDAYSFYYIYIQTDSYKQHNSYINSADELDKFAFAYIIMRCVFDHNIYFKGLEQNRYAEKVNYLIQEYPEDKLIQMKERYHVIPIKNKKTT